MIDIARMTRGPLEITAAIAVVAMVCAAPAAHAQSDAVAHLQKDDAAFNAQLHALENKMGQKGVPATQNPAGANKPAAAVQEQPDFADKKIHMGGVTITPGGFLAIDGLAHDR
jgi:hypothetical protein